MTTAEKQRLLQKLSQVRSQTDENDLMKRLIAALESMGSITGYQGPPGKQGPPGRVPVKGEDYFTPAEIRELIRIVTPVKGRDYFDGEDGKSIKGDKGDKGDPGEKADMAEVEDIAEDKAEMCMEEHMKECDHSMMHDPKMLGEYELDAPSIQNGDILQVKGKKLVGVKLKLPDMGVIRGWVASQGASNIRHDSVTSSRELEPFVFWIVDATAGNITLTIPSASGRENQWFEIMRIDGSANTVTVVPTGSETFSGMTSYELSRWTDFKLFGYQGNYLIRQAT